MHQKGSAALLAVKRSAGVIPDVNLNRMQVTKHTSKVSTLALKARTDVNRRLPSPKQVYIENDLLSSKKKPQHHSYSLVVVVVYCCLGYLPLVVDVVVAVGCCCLVALHCTQLISSHPIDDVARFPLHSDWTLNSMVPKNEKESISIDMIFLMVWSILHINIRGRLYYRSIHLRAFKFPSS